MSKGHSRQHFVPQFYLKNFSNEDKKNKSYCIYCFDKKNQKIYPQNIKNIAQKRDFYEIESISLEKKLSNMESKWAPILNSLVKNKKPKILNNLNTRCTFSIFLYFQFIRTEMHRNNLYGFNYQLNYILNDNFNIAEDFQSQLINMLDEEYIKSFHMDQLSSISLKIIFFIMNKKWCLLKNKTSTSFWTSDNPVVKYNPENLGHGFISEYIHIYFPLSPNLCLCLLDPSHYKGYNQSKDFDRESSIINCHNATLSKLNNPKDIEFINQLQIKYSNMHIFSKFNDLDNCISVINSNDFINSFDWEFLKIKDEKGKERDFIHFKNNY